MHPEIIKFTLLISESHFPDNVCDTGAGGGFTV